MEQIEIYLNKLCDSAEIYKETSGKTGGEFTDRPGLEKWLEQQTQLPPVKLYVSDEQIDNPAVDEVIAAFGDRAEVMTDEFLNLIDETAHITAQSKPRSLVHRDGDLHAAVHVWVIRRRDMGVYVLLQKRSHQKKISPDCYDVSAAGHVTQNGEFRATAVRETAEEIGLKVKREQLQLIGLLENHHDEGDKHDNELRAVYLYNGAVDEDSLMLQESEVSEIGWAELDEVLTVMKNEGFPNCLDLRELDLIKKAVF